MTGLMIGDRVRVASEGSEHDGRTGWVSCVDDGALFYVDSGTGDDLLGPFCRNELVEVQFCDWFVRCENAATGTLYHPILGDVAVCDRCRKVAAE